MKPSSTSLPALLLVLAAAPARAGVLTVDASRGPGADFATIQAAVDAAREGDTIVVRDGTYGNVVVHARSLSIVSDGPRARIDGSIWVRSLAPHQCALVRGFRASFGAHVANCAGAVWLEDIESLDASGACSFGDRAGSEVWSSSSVTLVRCTLQGERLGTTTSGAIGSGPGLEARASRVHAFDCRLLGGAGRGGGSGLPALPGGPGLRVDESTVTLSGCTVVGGPGGLGEGPTCDAAVAAGGAGMELLGAAGAVRSLDSTIVGGALDLGLLCPGRIGPQGEAVCGTGSIATLPGFARRVRSPTPVRGGATLALEIEGRAGDLPVLLVSSRLEPAAPPGTGPLASPSDDLLLLPVLADGAAFPSFAVPNVGSAYAGQVLFAQAVFLDASSTIRLGAGTSIVLLDAGA